MAKGAIAFLLATAVFAAAAQAATKPRLRLLQASPVTLRGTGFHPGERVRVTVQADGPARTRTARATSAGVFTIQLALLPFDPCNSSLIASALGADGDSATLKLPQRACPPAP